MRSEFAALVAALLLFEAVHRAGVLRRKDMGSVHVLWLLVIGGVAMLGHEVFAGSPAFVWGLLPLLSLQVLRVAMGTVGPETGFLTRWRYVPVLGVAWATDWSAWTLAAFLVLALNRRGIRAFLLALTRMPGPVRLSVLDVDQILPPPIVYDRNKREEGMALMEVITGMTALAVVTSAIFLGVVQRSVRLRQIRETASAREAAVSTLERSSAEAFEDLVELHGTEFPAGGGAGPGRVEILLVEEGLAEVTVVAPRRGCTPIVLRTYRTERLP